jgi:hypothetical protein
LAVALGGNAVNARTSGKLRVNAVQISSRVLERSRQANVPVSLTLDMLDLRK